MQKQFSIRPFHPNDCTALLSIHTAAIMAVNPAIYPEHIKKAWAYGLSTEGYACAVADGEVFEIACDVSGEPVGFCGCKGNEVFGPYVHPSMHGEGVGAALLKRAEARLKESGVTRSPLHATLSAVPFYRQHGWQFLRIRHVRTRGGAMMETALMEKNLG